MRKLVPIHFASFALLVLVVAGICWHRALNEARWRTIAVQVPATPLNGKQTSALPSNGWLSGFATNEYEVGQVVLRDGEVWRFAFASHHNFDGPDSYTVFKSHQGTIRVRGEGFCCEVEFDDQKQPAGLQEFVSLLRRRGDDVEILSGR